ncbi:MAG TPA: trigger factor [Planctomycetota bacterium]|nr:trigger factor [Planctomycetota bacterium]
MDVQVEKTGPCEARVRFQVAADEFRAHYRKQLASAGKQLRVKGFRPGHVPPQVVEKLHGDAVRREAVEHFVRDAYREAVEREKLEPALHPKVDVAELRPDDAAGLAHDFTLVLKPEFELGVFEGLAVERRAPTVDDEELERTLTDVRRQQAHPEPAGEAGLPKDGLALAKLVLLHGDEVVAERDGLRISPTTPPAGADPERFEAALVGAVEGVTVEVPLVFPDAFEREELRGKSGVVRITPSQVFRLVEPTEQELQRAFRATDPADLRAKVREQLLAAKVEAEDRRIEDELFTRVLDAHPMDLPPSMLDQQIAGRKSAAVQQLVGEGLEQAEAERRVEQDDTPTRDAAEKSLRAFFLVQRIGDAAGLRVGQQDLAQELQQIARRNRVSLEEVRDYYEQHGLFQQLSVELLERKVRTHLRERAAVGGGS